MVFALVVLVGSGAGWAPQRANAALPSAECANLGDGWRHCYSVAFEFTRPNGGSSTWQDANYNPNCLTHAFIIQDFWFTGPVAPDGGVEWSEFGHQSCKNDGMGTGGQYWVAFASNWTQANGRRSSYLFRLPVTTEQFHRYEIRTDGNGTQTFQIDSTQLYTGVGPAGPFRWVSGEYLQTGVEVTVNPNSNVLPIWTRDATAMTVIPASCGCNHVHEAWDGPWGALDCNYLSNRNPDRCRNDFPLNGVGYSPTWYRYWGQ